MFAKLSENTDRPKGKLSDGQTLKMKASTYELGRPEWGGNWESQTKHAYRRDEGPIEKTKSFKMAGSQICFGSDKLNYLTNTNANFQQSPPDFVPARPLKDRIELCATNYSLGEDRTEYKSAAMMQFRHPQKVLMKQQPSYKNQNERVDVITGYIYNQNKRSFPFEGYTDDSQHKVSQNKTVLPQDFYVNDPITGRPIIRKGRVQ